jgi:hypothetical protein
MAMKPDELKKARRDLGLSANEFARVFGAHDGRTVRAWNMASAMGFRPASLAQSKSSWLSHSKRQRRETGSSAARIGSDDHTFLWFMGGKRRASHLLPLPRLSNSRAAI